MGFITKNIFLFNKFWLFYMGIYFCVNKLKSRAVNNIRLQCSWLNIQQYANMRIRLKQNLNVQYIFVQWTKHIVYNFKIFYVSYMCIQ